MQSNNLGCALLLSDELYAIQLQLSLLIAGPTLYLLYFKTNRNSQRYKMLLINLVVSCHFFTSQKRCVTHNFLRVLVIVDVSDLDNAHGRALWRSVHSTSTISPGWRILRRLDYHLKQNYRN